MARRLGSLDLLAQTERSVKELAGPNSLTVANASQHLQQLRRVSLGGRTPRREEGDLQAGRPGGAARRLVPYHAAQRLRVEKVLNILAPKARQPGSGVT